MSANLCEGLQIFAFFHEDLLLPLGSLRLADSNHRCGKVFQRLTSSGSDPPDSLCHLRKPGTRILQKLAQRKPNK